MNGDEWNKFLFLLLYTIYRSKIKSFSSKEIFLPDGKMNFFMALFMPYIYWFISIFIINKYDLKRSLTNEC